MAIRPHNVQVRFANDPPAEDPSDSSSGFPRRSTVQAIALVVLVLAVYAASARSGFIFNDAREIASNPALRTWREGLLTIWLYPAAMPHVSPVAYTFMLAEMKLVGGRPMGFRAASVALHAAVVLLLWALLSRLDVPGAFLAAALFAVHPAQVETVTWAGQQRLLLCAIFYVAGLLRWARRDEAGPSVVALSILAMFCHPMGLTFPLALAVLVAWRRRPLRRTRWRRAAFVVPLVAVAYASWILGTDLSLARPAEAGWRFWLCLVRLVWPVGPSARFAPPAGTGVVWILALGVFVAVAVAARRMLPRAVSATILLFGLLLLPALMLPADGAVDPWLYLAIAPVAALLGAAVPARVGVGAPVVAALGVIAILRLPAYQSDRAMWEAVMRIDPRSAVALTGLGKLELSHSPRSATDLFERALRIEPTNRDTLVNLAAARVATGEPDRAVVLYQRVLADHPRDADARMGLAVARAQQDRSAEAVEQLREALRLRPKNARAHRELAALHGSRGEVHDALRHAEEALRLGPRDPDNHLELAGLLYNHFDDAGRAQELLARARRIDPGKPQTVLLAGAIQVELARSQRDPSLRRIAFETAVGFYREAVRLDPGSALAHRSLGIALAALAQHLPQPRARLGALNESVFCFERSEALDPAQPDIRALREAAIRDRDAAARADRQ